MKLCGIYCIENLVDGKRYIGQSTYVAERLRDHRRQLRAGKHDNQRLQHAWNKHGAANFAFRTVAAVPREHLDQIEQFFVSALSAMGRCYNINTVVTAPPMRGRNHSDETKKRLRDARARQPGHRFTAEQRARQSAAAKGRPKSQSHRAALSAALTGRPTNRRLSPTPETRLKISRSLTGRKRSPAAIEKAAAAVRGTRRGPPSPTTRAKISRTLTGRPLTAEHRARIADGNKGKGGNSDSARRGWITRRTRHE